MRRIKTFGLILVLSLGLAGNIFAMGSVTAAPGLLSFALEQVVSLFGRTECPLRQCHDCRPNNGADDDGNGNCRPQ